MASLRKRRRGGSLMFELNFYVNGKRKTIPLGVKYTERTATELKGVVETLLRCKDNGVTVPDKRTSAWIETASREIREKLAKAGLVELPPSHTLKELWDRFLAYKVTHVKESTFRTYDSVKRRFFLFFGQDELVEDVSKERIQRWKDLLFDEVAGATVAHYIKETKIVFNWARDQGWIEASPLYGIGTGSFVNKENDHIVPMSDYRRFLDASPCQDW